MNWMMTTIQRHLAGGCGRLLPVVHTLQATSKPARVFTLQLGWQKEQEDSEAILDTLSTISEVLDPGCPLHPISMAEC